MAYTFHSMGNILLKSEHGQNTSLRDTDLHCGFHFGSEPHILSFRALGFCYSKVDQMGALFRNCKCIVMKGFLCCIKIRDIVIIIKASLINYLYIFYLKYTSLFGTLYLRKARLIMVCLTTSEVLC